MRALCAPDNEDWHFWIRRDIKVTSESAERRFLDTLQKDLDVATIATELYSCKASGGSCAYVVRTVFRFIPEFHRRNALEDALALFTEPGDRAVLEGWRDGRAHTAVMQAVRAR